MIGINFRGKSRVGCRLDNVIIINYYYYVILRLQPTGPFKKNFVEKYIKSNFVHKNFGLVVHMNKMYYFLFNKN